jgi:alpha-tubulin suppressor-like RCC1 family protein
MQRYWIPSVAAALILGCSSGTSVVGRQDVPTTDLGDDVTVPTDGMVPSDGTTPKDAQVPPDGTPPGDVPANPDGAPPKDVQAPPDGTPPGDVPVVPDGMPPGDGGGADGGDASMRECVPESTRLCYSGPAGTISIGRCRGGTQVCGADGRWSVCTNEVTPAMTDTCGNMMDDNCNGVSDEGCNECTSGMTRTCYTGSPGTQDVGRCRGGMQTCDAMGRWPTTCMGETTPAATETCGNMMDDDCNGMVDDNCGQCEAGMTRPCYNGATGTQGVGRCQEGTQTCGTDRMWAMACAGEVAPAAMETCGNGIDDNCNGRADEDCPECTSGMTRPCYTGAISTLNVGACRAGTQTCDAMGRWPTACAGQVTPAAMDTCNNMVDENCSGMADEGCGECTPGMTRMCYSGPSATRGVGRCAAGTQVCGSNGFWMTACIGEVTPAAMETCGNMVDDDCNGMPENGCGECTPNDTRSCYTGASGTQGVGRCRAGMQVCQGDRAWPRTCTGEVIPASETCNGADDDCDGMQDEDPASSACMLANATSACRSGACAVNMCTAPFADCDMMAANGCETNTATSAMHCGACGRACAMGQLCVSGRCSGSQGLDIAAGEQHSCAVLADGSVACWGYNNAGQVGDNTTVNRTHPTLVRNLTGVTDIEAGARHTCAIYGSGSVSCWGQGSSGQIGDGSTANRPVPTQVFGVSDASQLATGSAHNCVLRTSGRVACWGFNNAGQLGDNMTATRTVPTDVPGLTGVVQVVAGYQHSCALRSNGRVTCWGLNSNGQLGDNTTTNRLVPTDVVNLTDAVQIAAGYSHTCALRANGTVQCWGYNGYGGIGDGTTAQRNAPVTVVTLTEAVQIEGGQYYTCARRASGVLTCWGYNGYGGIGDGSTTNRALPVDLAAPRNVQRFVLGYLHTCARVTTGDVHCWGYNASGQLGDGSVTNRSSVSVPIFGINNGMTCTGTACALPLGAGLSHVCAVRPNGSLACWGRNNVNQLGDATALNRYGPVVSAATSVAEVKGGAAHTCARLTSGMVACWGQGTSGQLGEASTANRPAPVMVFGLTDAAQISLGDNFSCAARTGGGVVCWGLNGNGQLGDGATANRLVPNPVGGASAIADATAVGTGALHACALRAGGAVSCWGYNNYGNLGDGSTTQRTSPVAVRAVGGAAGSTLTGVTRLAVGTTHACGIRADASVVCWGYNGYGQIGDGTTANRSSPVVVLGLTDAVDIVAGGNHTCARRNTGAMVCWGYNGYGQIGDGTTTNRPLPTTVLSSLDVARVTAAQNSTCVRRTNGTVSCWGYNGYGELGDGWTTNRPQAADPIFGLP